MDQTQDFVMDLSRGTLTVDQVDHRRISHERQPCNSYRVPSYFVRSRQADRRDLNVSDYRLSTIEFSTMPQNKSRTAGKRQIRRLRTLQDKMNAIVRVHAGESKAGVARDIGVPESTLRGWCKEKEKISCQLNNTRPAGTNDQSKITLDDFMKNLDSSVTPNRNLELLTGTKRDSEKDEIELSPKQRKLENNFLASDPLAAAVMNTISMSNDEIYPAVTYALYRRIQYHLNNPCANDLNLALSHWLYGNNRPPPSSSSLSSSAANLLVNNQQLQQFPTRNNEDAMENVLPTYKIFSKSSKYDAVGLTSTVENSTEVATKSQSPNAESTFESINNQNFPMPSTSTNDDCAITNTFTKSSERSSRKLLCDISNQLRQQDVLLPVRECNGRNDLQ